MGSALGYTDWRIPSFTEDALDPDMKPMSQDSYSGGLEYQLAPTTVLAVNYIHNNLIRTIEDVGQLIDGSEVYTYGNPGEGLVEAAFVSTATTPFNVPRTEARIRRASVLAQSPVLEQLVPGRQLHAQPPLWELRRHCQLRRNPHTGQQLVRVRSAAGRRHCAALVAARIARSTSTK